MNHQADGPEQLRDWEPPRLVELPAEATADGTGALLDGSFALT